MSLSMVGSGMIKLIGLANETSGGLNVGVKNEIGATATLPLRLTATTVRSLFAIASGMIKLRDGYGHCWSYCSCNVNCACDTNCVCDLCPAPEVPMLMADGTEKLAGDIKVGDMVWAWDEGNKRFAPREITSHKIGENLRMLIVLSNGRSGEFAVNHRFLTLAGTWVELRDLKMGDVLHGDIRVVRTEDRAKGPVVSMVVNELHTYVTLGVVSHNAKCGTL